MAAGDAANADNIGFSIIVPSYPSGESLATDQWHRTGPLPKFPEAQVQAAGAMP